MVNITNEEDKYIITRYMYSILEEPLMSDEEYNAVTRDFRERNILREYTERTWSDDPCPTELLKKYGMEKYIYQVQNVEKTESIASILSEEEAKRYYEDRRGRFHVSYKEDAINIQKTYYNGKLIAIRTRGRTGDYIDFSQYISIDPVQEIPLLGEVRIVGEMQLSDINFRKLKEIKPNLVSQRASVKSALTSSETAKLLEFKAFDIVSDREKFNIEEMYLMLRRMGFDTPKYIMVNSGDDVLEAVKELSENKYNYGYQTDGVVVRSDDASSNDKMAVRIYNWTEHIYKTYVEEYEETQSNKYYGFKLMCYPVLVKGSTIRRINVTNLKTVINYGLLPGMPVAFTMRSDAIPVIDLEETRKLINNKKGDYENYRQVVKLNYEKDKAKGFN